MLQNKVQNAGILLPIFKKDLENTVEKIHREKKYLYYFDLQCSIVIEQSCRIAYDHLRAHGKIEHDQNKRYAFRDDFYRRWNPVGKALFQPELTEAYVGYHTIEFFVNLFCFKSQSKYYEHYLKHPFSMLDNYSLADLFMKTPFYKRERSHQYAWQKTFEYKAWKHYYIYEYEQFCPGSFMQFIRQWYAPQQYLHEKETILKILREQFSTNLLHQHKFGLSYPNILKDPTINENLFQLYQLKKFPLSRSSMFTLSKIDAHKYTTRELCRMEYCDFGVLPTCHWIDVSGPLSPYYNHHFTLHGLRFQNVHQYVCFRLVKMFSKNILFAYESSTKHQFQQAFSKALGIVHDRSIYQTCQEYRNSPIFHQNLLEDTSSFSNNPHVQEMRDSLLNWIGCKELVHEKLLFLTDCFDFCQWKATSDDFERLRELFYPAMKKTVELEDIETGEIYSEIPHSVRNVIRQYLHEATLESFTFPRRFFSHFLKWFSSCEKPFRKDCLRNEFLNMLIRILKRHRYHKEKCIIDNKTLKQHFSPAECIMIKQIF
jgi:hypothetical protein